MSDFSLSKKQIKVLMNALRYFKSLNLINQFRFVKFNSHKPNSVHIVSKELFDFIQDNGLDTELKEKLVNIGIKVGEIGKRFRFTLEGAYIIAKAERKKVYINEKAEMLFLYGRDIFSNSVLRASKDVKENDIVFVCNCEGDILGIGKARFDFNRICSMGDRVAVENLVDRGEYLRKDKLYDAF